MYKILFIDDEQNILQYLPIAIDWGDLGIDEMETASNGRNALRIAEEFRPDIAIVDVEMPEMDGLEFTRRALHILPDLKIVILSAFDRFDYAKRAISSGVKDYILKPVDEEELESVIRKILIEIEQTKHKSYNIEKMTLKALEKELKELSEHFIRNESYTAALEIDFPILKEYENISIVVQDKDEAVFYSEKLIAADTTDGLAVSFEDGVWAFFWKKETAISMREQIEEFERLGKKEKRIFRFYYTRKQKEEGAAQALERCFHALEQAFYSQEYHIEAGQAHLPFSQADLEMPDLNDALKLLSEEGEVWALEDGIQNEVKNAFAAHAPSAAICQMVFDMFITMKIYLTKCWQEEALKIFRKMSVWSFLRCSSQERLHALIHKNISELQVFVKKQKESHGNMYIVKVAKNYTKEHYQNPELSLQEIADAVGISRTYFSAIFKELTGERYWDYLTGYRIEQAKKMLKETNLSQAVISEQVGYSSEFHFSRKFKELIGISPNKYRKK